MYNIYESNVESLFEEAATINGMIGELKAKARMLHLKHEKDETILETYQDMIERMRDELDTYDTRLSEIEDELEFHAQRKEECEEA